MMYWRFALFILIGFPAWILLGVIMGLRLWWDELTLFVEDW